MTKEEVDEKMRDCKFTIFDYETAEPMEITPELDAKARRHARRWLREHGGLPAGHHPFNEDGRTDWFHTKYVIDYVRTVPDKLERRIGQRLPRPRANSR